MLPKKYQKETNTQREQKDCRTRKIQEIEWTRMTDQTYLQEYKYLQVDKEYEVEKNLTLSCPNN